MLDPKQITAVVVTKGDRDIARVLESLSVFGETIVWDNGAKQVTSYYGGGSIGERIPEAAVYGRYLAAARARFDTVYVQDDDCLINPLEMLLFYEPGKVICNMKPAHAAAPYYQWRIKLVGFGAIFEKRLIDFRAYLSGYENDRLFRIECDRVFTALNECVECQVPIVDLEYASDDDRLWRQADHGQRMREINARLRGMLG